MLFHATPVLAAPEAIPVIGGCEMVHGEAPAKAARDWCTTIVNSATDPKTLGAALYYRAAAEIELGLLDDARSDLERARENLRDHPDVLSDLGYVFTLQGRFDDAVSVLNSAIVKDGRSGILLAQRALAQRWRGEYAAAVRDLRAALGAGVTLPTAHIELAISLAFTGDVAGGRAELNGVRASFNPKEVAWMDKAFALLEGAPGATPAQSCVQSKPEDSSVIGACTAALAQERDRSVRAGLLTARGLHWIEGAEIVDSAVADAEAATRLDPDSPNTMFVRAYALLLGGFGSKALEVVEAGQRAEPSEQIWQQLKALAQLQLGRFADAKATADAAIAAYPAVAALYEIRANAYEGLGDKAKADVDRAKAKALADAPAVAQMQGPKLPTLELTGLKRSYMFRPPLRSP